MPSVSCRIYEYFWVNCEGGRVAFSLFLITRDTSARDSSWRHDPPPPGPETRDQARRKWSQPTRVKENLWRTH